MQLTPDQADATVASIFEFGWEPSRNGNYVRMFRGKKLVVFQRHGAWHWCINVTNRKQRPPAQFSQRSYKSPDEAIAALKAEVCE